MDEKRTEDLYQQLSIVVEHLILEDRTLFSPSNLSG